MKLCVHRIRFQSKFLIQKCFAVSGDEFIHNSVFTKVLCTQFCLLAFAQREMGKWSSLRDIFLDKVIISMSVDHRGSTEEVTAPDTPLKTGG